MNMKKYKILLTVISLIIVFSSFVVNAIGSLDSINNIDNTKSSSKDISEEAGVNTTRTIPEIIGLIIKIIIGLCGTICLVIIIYSGVMIMTAGGNKEQMLKARKNLAPTIIGLFILSAAYAITDFIIKQITTVAG